ncbi:MAG: hypothetical protein AB1772_00775 [Candidatus Zixiibacteriota bacterium]
MLGPDGVDRIQPLPHDKIIQTQHADPDKRQKFSRALEEEEEELERRRKKQPHDQVKLESDSGTGGPAEGADSDLNEEQSTGSDEQTVEEPKHIDVKA